MLHPRGCHDNHPSHGPSSWTIVVTRPIALREIFSAASTPGGHLLVERMNGNSFCPRPSPCHHQGKNGDGHAVYVPPLTGLVRLPTRLMMRITPVPVAFSHGLRYAIKIPFWSYFTKRIMTLSLPYHFDHNVYY
jgi:hypothetical protein